MRLEIIIPDDTDPELKARLTRLTKQLSAHPERVAELDDAKTEEIPDYLAIMKQAQLSPYRFKTTEEVDAYIAALRDEW